MSLSIESENKAIQAARAEMQSWLDYLGPKDIQNSHDVTREEAVRAIAILESLLAKLGAKDG